MFIRYKFNCINIQSFNDSWTFFSTDSTVSYELAISSITVNTSTKVMDNIVLSDFTHDIEKIQSLQ